MEGREMSEKREIKFRAWDSEFGSMVTDFREGYSISMRKGKFEVGSIDGNGDYFSLDVMQFTGLKDKDGVDVYEGDICEWGNDRVQLVEFTDGSFHFKGLTSFPTLINARKVIGNIHENPELHFVLLTI